MGKIILENSLQAFFFKQLQDYNAKFTDPLGKEFIYYSSNVMDQYALVENFFSNQDGKKTEKILGLKYLEALNKNDYERAKDLKEIGDIALLSCGYFSESLENKIVSEYYYYSLGKMAYSNLNGLIPVYLDKKYFFDQLSKIFDQLVSIIMIISKKFNELGQIRYQERYTIKAS